MPSFGFDANGTYYIELDLPMRSQSSAQIAFLNKKQYMKYFFKFFPPSICDMDDIPKYDFDLKNKTLKGRFTEKVDIYPFLLRCYQIIDKYEIKIHTEYRNPTTFLDNQLVNGIYGEMTVFIMYIIFFFIWILYFVKISQRANMLQNVITAIILLFTISHVFRFFELKQLDKMDVSKGLTNLRIFFNFLIATVSCFFILFCSEGFCILNDSLSNQRNVTFVIVSLLFSGSLFLTFYSDFSNNYYQIVFLDFFCFILFSYELFESLKHASVQIESLLLSASNSGNSPNNSSILRNKQYKLFHRIFVAILCSLVFCLAFYDFSFLIKKWLNELFVNLLIMSIVAAAAVIFRPIKSVFSIDSNEIADRLIIEDAENEYSADNDDEIPLNSIDGTSNTLRNAPTPDQPLLQQEPNAKSNKKTNGNKFNYL